ncbi:MAG: DinB family protein [Terracoccus sp.]
MTTTPTALVSLLVEQIDAHWTGQLRPRLEGLTDAEYYWEPTPGAWGLHPRGEAHTALAGGRGDVVVDFAMPAPEPAPVTTIGWRLAHLVVGVLGARVHGHFGGPAVDYPTFDYAPTATGALTQLDVAYAAWLAGVRGWTDEELALPCGPAEGPWAESSRAVLMLHLNRELIHHGAEVALLRDLWLHRHDRPSPSAVRSH